MDLKKILDRFPGAWLLAAVVIVGVALGCSDNPAPTVPVDDTPPAPTTTETFTGTFTQSGRSQHTFTVVARGNIVLEITSLAPVETLTVGLGIGRFDETTDPPCFLFASDNRVVVGAELVSSNADPGEYCFSIGDVGNVFPDATVTYTVDVTHP